MRRPMPPCGKDCPKRRAGCHSECEPYRVFEKKNAAFRDERRKAQQTKDAINQLTDHCVRSITHGEVRYCAKRFST